MLNPKSLLVARAEQALAEQLPVDQKTLRRVGKLLEPRNIKRLAIGAVGTSAAFSLVGSIGRTRIYRAAVARELKKQLGPINKKLEDLEAQNEELKRQNERLERSLAQRRQTV